VVECTKPIGWFQESDIEMIGNHPHQLAITLLIADQTGVVECEVWGKNAELFLHTNVDAWINNCNNIHDKFNNVLISCARNKKPVVFDLVSSSNADNTLCYVGKGRVRWDLDNLKHEFGKSYSRRLSLVALSPNKSK
jgi:hypothetical protein